MKNRFFRQNEKSDIMIFREKYLKKNIELINITSLCQPKLGDSGWCNDINEPDETIHHIQLWYRDDIVANIGPDGIDIIDEDKYCLFITNKDDITGSDFIIFRKCKK
jgi:hypothetical protein